jgi:hypothetical protein
LATRPEGRITGALVFDAALAEGTAVAAVAAIVAVRNDVDAPPIAVHLVGLASGFEIRQTEAGDQQHCSGYREVAGYAHRHFGAAHSAQSS